VLPLAVNTIVSLPPPFDDEVFAISRSVSAACSNYLSPFLVRRYNVYNVFILGDFKLSVFNIATAVSRQRHKGIRPGMATAI
jgi:hypothetical protein